MCEVLAGFSSVESRWLRADLSLCYSRYLGRYDPQLSWTLLHQVSAAAWKLFPAFHLSFLCATHKTIGNLAPNAHTNSTGQVLRPCLYQSSRIVLALAL